MTTEEVRLPRGIGISHRSLEEMETQLKFLEKLKEFWFDSEQSQMIDDCIATCKEQIAYIERKLFQWK